ncbi:hypothetical protein DRQ33_01615 [bacterium]|nr:MAG: hypothetical protein DRQ33_01615 [bacterium]
MRVPSPKTRAEIISLLHAPTVVEGSFLIIKARKNPPQKSLMVSVSARCGNAVRRNRIRRIVREWFRVNWESIPEDMSFLVKVLPSTRNLSKNKLSPSIRNELHQLMKQFYLPKK